MKSIPAAITTHIAGDLTTLATCWVLTRTDGVAYYFTDHDADISITDTSNGVDGTYESSTGYTASSISSNLDLAVDNLDINGLMASSSINEADIVAGLYDNAEVKIFMVNWQSPDDGIVKLRRGWLGELELRDQIYVAEMRGMAQAMQQPNGRTFGPDCDAQIGDDRCKVRTDPPEWAATTVYTERLDKDAGTGSVVKPSSENGRHFKCSTPGTSGVSEPSWDTTIGNTTNDGTVVWTTIRALTVTGVVTDTPTDRKTFNDSGIAMPSDWFTGGTVTWITGDNAGRSMEIKSFDGSEFELALPMPNDIANSDTFTVTVGCDRSRLSDCKTRFDNVINFRGFDSIPGPDEVLKHGGQ